MICAECDTREERYIGPRTEMSLHFYKGTLTDALKEQLGREEGAAREAIFDHRAKDHKVGEKYE
jgi:hypothetical protein